MAKKSDDAQLIDEVRQRAAFIVGCEPEQHCAILDLGFEETRAGACRRLTAAAACLNARSGEPRAVQIIRRLSIGVYTGVALGPYDTARAAAAAAERATQALAAHAERERRACDARQDAEARREIEAAQEAERQFDERRALEAEAELAMEADLGR